MIDIYVIYCEGEVCYVGQAINMDNRWRKHKSDHRNPTSRSYNLKISQHMREKGWDNFKMEFLEAVPDKHASQAEGLWFWTFKDLGFDLKYGKIPGNGRSNVLGTIAYENSLARQKEKIPCERCSKMISRCNMRRHQRGLNCI